MKQKTTEGEEDEILKRSPNIFIIIIYSLISFYASGELRLWLGLCDLITICALYCVVYRFCVCARAREKPNCTAGV